MERGGKGRESGEREERASRDEEEGERVRRSREREIREGEISVSLRVNGGDEQVRPKAALASYSSIWSNR